MQQPVHVWIRKVPSPFEFLVGLSLRCVHFEHFFGAPLLLGFLLQLQEEVSTGRVRLLVRLLGRSSRHRERFEAIDAPSEETSSSLSKAALSAHLP